MVPVVSLQELKTIKYFYHFFIMQSETSQSTQKNQARTVLESLVSFTSQCRDVVDIIASYSKSCQYLLSKTINIIQSVRDTEYNDIIQSCCTDPETGDIFLGMKYSQRIIVYNCQGDFQRMIQMNFPDFVNYYILQICTDGRKLAIRTGRDRLFICSLHGKLLHELSGIYDLGGIAMYNKGLVVSCNHSIYTFDLETGKLTRSVAMNKTFFYIYVDKENGDIYGYYGSIYVFSQDGCFQRILKLNVTSGGMMINALNEIVICNPDDVTAYSNGGVINEELLIYKFGGKLDRIVSFTVNEMLPFGCVSFCDGRRGKLVICRGQIMHIIE